MSSEGPDDLGERIARAQSARADKLRTADSEVEDSGVSAGALALRYGAEFGASVGVGIGIGLAIDHFAGTKPWGLLAMMGFGFAAGIMNVVRAYRQLTAEAAQMGKSPPDDGAGNGKTG